MHFFTLLTLLPALAVAQNQIPFGERFQGWLDRAKSYIVTPTPLPEPKAPVEVVQKTINPLNFSNWQSVLMPSEHIQDWLIFVTGGNKTCFGRCERAEKAFNQSISLFATDSTSPELAYLNCETEQILCSILVASAPTVWYIQISPVSPDQPRPASPLHIVSLNATTVTAETIYKIHSGKTYEAVPRYEGILHPFDGLLAQYGLNVPLGYVMYGFSTVPNWLFMIAISFFSRSLMSRRLANPSATAGRPAPAGRAN